MRTSVWWYRLGLPALKNVFRTGTTFELYSLSLLYQWAVSPLLLLALRGERLEIVIVAIDNKVGQKSIQGTVPGYITKVQNHEHKTCRPASAREHPHMYHLDPATQICLLSFVHYCRPEFICCQVSSCPRNDT